MTTMMQIRSDQIKHLERAKRQLSIGTGDGDIARAKAEFTSAHHKISTIRTHSTCHQIHQTTITHFTFWRQTAMTRSAMLCKCKDIHTVNFWAHDIDTIIECPTTEFVCWESCQGSLPSSSNANKR
jgi:hypothetical protein